MDDLEHSIQDIVLNQSGYNKYVDFMRVPCKLTCVLPGLAFLSAKATEELKHSNRADELLPEDDVELYFFYAKHLYKAGLCKLEFPSFYKSARALFAESTAAAIGTFCPFYFELGYELCSLIPENEWPVENLQGILREAECKRRCFLIKRNNSADDTFYTGLTHDEKKLFNVLAHGNSNVLISVTDSQNINEFYGFDI